MAKKAAKDGNSILSIFHNEPRHIPNDRNYQEYHLFINDEDVQKDIKFLRMVKRIDPRNIKSRLNQYRLLQDRLNSMEIGVDVDSEQLIEQQGTKEHERLRKECSSCINRLHESVGSRIGIKDIEVLLKEYNKPFSWADSLAGYVLTGIIRRPLNPYQISYEGNVLELKIFPDINWLSYLEAIDYVRNLKFLRNAKSRCKVYIRNEAVILEIAGKVQVTFLRKIYKRVRSLSLKLSGSSIRSKRRKSLDNHLKTAIEEEKVRKIPIFTKDGRHPRKEKRLSVAKALLDEGGVINTISGEVAKRLSAQRRQIYSRNKHRVKDEYFDITRDNADYVRKYV